MRKNDTLNLYAAGIFFLGALPVMGQTFDNGIIILNEGGAGSNNASVSYLQAGTTSISNNIYANANMGLGPLGDTGQSMSFAADNAYVVLNISNTVKVVNRHTFEYVTTISEGLVNPRYMGTIANRGYITIRTAAKKPSAGILPLWPSTTIKCRSRSRSEPIWGGEKCFIVSVGFGRNPV